MNEIKKVKVQMVCPDCNKVTGTLNYYGENAPSKSDMYCPRGC